jgi:DNA helicase HerA-like ATPase
MMRPSLQERLEAFRADRRELESSILPLATSLDGRQFTFQAPLPELELQVGGYVVLEGDGESWLGQTLGLEMERVEVAGSDGMTVAIRHARGEGAILDGRDHPFHDALVRPAAPDEVRDWAERTARRRARLPIGSLTLAPGVGHELDAGGFDRHSFLCGQSGSGKTYSLGVIVERLLMDTTLRLVILDPNSDFVRLGSVREGADADEASRYAGVAGGVEVHSADGAGGERLRLAVRELQPAEQAALLRLDPIADREEYAELVALLEEQGMPSLDSLVGAERPEARRLGMRVRNLGAYEWGIWARGEPGSLLDALEEDGPRCLVVDLGSLPTREEQSLVAAAVLGRLWSRRTRRAPMLIVIDEAHNVCPGNPEDPLTALATDAAVRIAAEGRKFGLYLLVSTQRPQKVHENVISQADNLVLMRLNSAADAAFTQDVFSFVPPELVRRSATFRLGEAVVAGKFSSHPALLRFGARVAEEGGADVPATWAEQSLPE